MMPPLNREFRTNRIRRLRTGPPPLRIVLGIWFRTGTAGIRFGDNVSCRSAVLEHAGKVSPKSQRLRQPANLDALLAAGTRSLVRAQARPAGCPRRPRPCQGTVENAPRGSDVQLHMPFTVGDYVDFYGNEHHATNVGRIFRPTQPPLTPNWKHLPIGYHGRSGSIYPSNTPVPRPKGMRPEADAAPSFGGSRRLDIEAEIGFVLGGSAPTGEVKLEHADRSHFRPDADQRLVGTRHPGFRIRSAGPQPRKILRNLDLAMGDTPCSPRVRANGSPRP